MTQHILKCWSTYWDAIECGDKNFEVRRDDRGFQKGDTLVLRKYDPEKRQIVYDKYGFGGLPKELRRTVTYVLTGGQLGIEPGFVVLGLREPDAP